MNKCFDEKVDIEKLEKEVTELLKEKIREVIRPEMQKDFLMRAEMYFLTMIEKSSALAKKERGPDALATIKDFIRIIDEFFLSDLNIELENYLKKDYLKKQNIEKRARIWLKEKRARIWLKMVGASIGVVYQTGNPAICDKINFAGESFDLGEVLDFVGRKPEICPLLTKNMAELEQAAQNRQNLTNALGKSLLFVQKDWDYWSCKPFYKKRFLVCHSQEPAIARFIILPLVNKFFYKRYIRNVIKAEAQSDV